MAVSDQRTPKQNERLECRNRLAASTGSQAVQRYSPGGSVFFRLYQARRIHKMSPYAHPGLSYLSPPAAAREAEGLEDHAHATGRLTGSSG